ncbi:hypothetical protein Dimus_037878 [Dionaea muscipula]
MAPRKNLRSDSRQAWRTAFPGVEKPSIFENHSVLTPLDLEDIRRVFPHPDDFELFLPNSNEIAIDIEKEKTLAIHLDHFRAGLRIPFHPFFVRVLNTYNLLPAHLSPMSIAQIIAFIIICRENSINPSMELFSRVFSLKKGFYYSLQPKKGYKLCYLENKVAGWKVKFVYATGEWGFNTERQAPVEKPDEPPARMTKELKRALTFFSEDRDDIRWYFEVNNPIALENYEIATVKHPRMCRYIGSF